MLPSKTGGSILHNKLIISDLPARGKTLFPHLTKFFPEISKFRITVQHLLRGSRGAASHITKKTICSFSES